MLNIGDLVLAFLAGVLVMGILSVFYIKNNCREINREEHKELARQKNLAGRVKNELMRASAMQPIKVHDLGLQRDGTWVLGVFWYREDRGTAIVHVTIGKDCRLRAVSDYHGGNFSTGSKPDAVDVDSFLGTVTKFVFDFKF